MSGAKSQGLSSVNSVWLSGCGVPCAAAAEEPRIDERLRGPALGEDWAAWAEAWHALDAGPIAALLDGADGTMLTLAGERHHRPFSLQTTSAWQRMRTLWHRAPAHQVLERCERRAAAPKARTPPWGTGRQAKGVP